MSASARIARWISIAGHPFVLVPLAIVVATSAPGAARGPVLGLVAASMAVIAVFVARSLRRGEVTDVDVSTREHRPGFYRVAIAAAAASTAILLATGQGAAAVRGAAVATVVLAAGALVNVRLKLSLHTAFAFMAAGVAYNAGWTAAAAFAGAACLVAWARVAYRRHTVSEVLGGAALGLVAAVAQAWPL